MIAVLDYGIGNLRSAEKALQHVGGDAHLVADPAEAEGAAGVVLPGVGAFGRCMEALRRQRPGQGGRRGGRRRHALPRDLRRHADALRRLRRGPRGARARDPAGRGPAAARLGQAAADAVERPAADPGRQRPARRARATTRGCTSCTPTPPSGPTTWSPPATTAARSWRPWSGAGCGRRSSTPRSRARSASSCWPTSSPPATGRIRLMDLYPAIDLRGGRCVRLIEGDFEPGDRLRRRPGRGGPVVRGRRRPVDPCGRPRRRPALG